MKSQKGVTLISLVIYIILLTLVLGFLSIVTNSFNRNLEYLGKLGKNMPSFNKFNMYFIEDVKNNKEVYSVLADKIIFADGTVYTYSNENIYRNKVKICENIPNISFGYREDTDLNDFTKKIITVEMTLNGIDIVTVENEYVLKYW